jgi:hypothetical protein
MLKKEVSNMSIIKGDSVENATTYELYEVTGGGYTVTCKADFNPNDYSFYVDDIRVSNSDVDQIFTDVRTIHLGDDYGGEVEHVADKDGNILLNEGETVVLTRDVVIARVEH